MEDIFNLRERFGQNSRCICKDFSLPWFYSEMFTNGANDQVQYGIRETIIRSYYDQKKKTERKNTVD
jgi:hypothetical protein